MVFDTSKPPDSANSGKCDKCRLPVRFCFCNELSTITLKHKVSIIMHHREFHLTSNTGNLAKLTIPQTNIHLRGLLGRPLQPQDIFLAGHTPLFLFPCEDALPLNQDLLPQFPGPLQLIVPDGSWRQASKFKKREDFLKNILAVKLDVTAPGRYFVRTTPHQEKLSTYEAMAYALLVLEGKENGPSIFAAMMRNFEAMVKANLKARAIFHHFKNEY